MQASCLVTQTQTCWVGKAAISGVSGVLDSIASDLMNDEKEAIWEIANNALISGGLSVITGSWGSDFSKSARAIDDAIDVVPKFFKGATKSTKQRITRKVLKAGKCFGKDFALSLGEDLSVMTIGVFTTFVSNGQIKRIITP